MSRFTMILWLVWLSFQATVFAEERKPLFAPTSDYEACEIEGWKVMVYRPVLADDHAVYRDHRGVGLRVS